MFGVTNIQECNLKWTLNLPGMLMKDSSFTDSDAHIRQQLVAFTFFSITADDFSRRPKVKIHFAMSQIMHCTVHSIQELSVHSTRESIRDTPDDWQWKITETTQATAFVQESIKPHRRDR